MNKNNSLFLVQFIWSISFLTAILTYKYFLPISGKCVINKVFSSSCDNWKDTYMAVVNISIKNLTSASTVIKTINTYQDCDYWNKVYSVGQICYCRVIEKTGYIVVFDTYIDYFPYSGNSVMLLLWIVFSTGIACTTYQWMTYFNTYDVKIKILVSWLVISLISILLLLGYDKIY